MPVATPAASFWYVRPGEDGKHGAELRRLPGAVVRACRASCIHLRYVRAAGRPGSAHPRGRVPVRRPALRRPSSVPTGAQLR
eukprot:COSAG01_NODE_144_length_24108_cov_11.490441_28_plen_82_part_00